MIAPPYDVVGPEAEARLLARSPHNCAHIELAPGPEAGRFERAARRFAELQAEGILVREAEPAFYLYEQEATIESERRLRRCFFAAVRLSPPEDGLIRPHESTMAGPRAERLALMHATAANISPIFAMFDDPDGRAREVLARVAAAPPAFSATDELGDDHRLWPIAAAADIRALRETVAGSTVTIADGHHRTTTALDYQAEQRAAQGSAWQPQGAVNYVLAGLIDAGEEGLVILPNHRLLRAPVPPGFERDLGAHFQLSDLSAELSTDPAGARKLLARVREHAAAPTTFGVILDGGQRFLLAAARSERELAASMTPAVPDALRRLDALVLTELVLGPLFGIDGARLSAGAVDFTADAGEAHDLVAQGSHSVAFLLNGTPVEQVVAVADAGEVMPQKTTYFYPKLATGMVFNLLDELSLGLPSTP